MKKYLILLILFSSNAYAEKFPIAIFNCKGAKDSKGHFFFSPSGTQIQVAKENNQILMNVSPFLIPLKKLNAEELQGTKTFRGTNVSMKFNNKNYSGVFKIKDPGRKELTFQFKCEFLHMHPSDITLIELNKREQSFLRK
jgi:hypothetical protein